MAFELELPALYVDAVLLDPTSARPALINRDPEPADVQVPIDASVALEVTDVGPDGIDVAATRVFVGGALAFSGGVFQAGFTGADSAATYPQPDTLRLVIDPLSPFMSLQVVDIRVVTQTMGGAFRLDTTWSFRCEDLTAPRVVGAQAREFKRVRVSFDEPVKQEDAGAPDDALSPACYSLGRLSAPAVEGGVERVEPVTSSSVDLLTEPELTPGAAYRVTVVGVVDLFGNPIAATGNTADFTGWVPPSPVRRRFELYQFLPALNRREDETGDLRRFLSCLQEVTELLVHAVDGFPDILDPDVAPEAFVDLMLVDLGNPFPFDLTIVDKRRLLNILVAIYREKGTAVGITNAIRFFLGLEVEIRTYTGEALILGESLLGEDWVLGPGGAFAAYAFEVVAPRALSGEERQRLRAIVEYMKPAHTHMARLVEPTLPETVDHLELGLSELGETWQMH